MKDRPVVRRPEQIPLKKIEAGTAAAMHVLLGPADGAPNFVLRRFVMEEGGGMPFHRNRVEHEQYVLGGAARVRIGEAIHDVTEGDVVYIPAGVPHSYEVVRGPFEFLCIVPNAEDEIEILGE